MNAIQRITGAAIRGLRLGRRPDDEARIPVELSDAEGEIFHHVRRNQLSMTRPERLWATLLACKYVDDQRIEGDFVECGVWRGGHALMAAETFRLRGAGRKVYLFDTFEGMTMPTVKDRVLASGKAAADKFLKSQKETHNAWCYASLEDVRNNFDARGLLDDRAVFVQGDVCQTLDVEANLPASISVLRLDTDWYASTKKELEVLYPRLAVGGVLILDDYGHWAGAKQATDEYFAARGDRPFLHYTDYSCRAGIRMQ